jgi:hypothetical protein
MGPRCSRPRALQAPLLFDAAELLLGRKRLESTTSHEPRDLADRHALASRPTGRSAASRMGPRCSPPRALQAPLLFDAAELLLGRKRLEPTTSHQPRDPRRTRRARVPADREVGRFEERASLQPAPRAPGPAPLRRGRAPARPETARTDDIAPATRPSPIATRSRPGRPGGRPLRGWGLVAARPARSRPRFSSTRPSSCSAGNGSNRRHRTSHATLADRDALASRPTGGSAASRMGPRCSAPRALQAPLLFDAAELLLGRKRHEPTTSHEPRDLADRPALASRPTGRSAASRKGSRCSLPSALPAPLRSGRAPARPETARADDIARATRPRRSRRARVPADRGVGRFEERVSLQPAPRAPRFSSKRPSSCSAGNGTSRRHRTSHATSPIVPPSRPGRPGGRPLRGWGLVAARPARSRPRFSSKRPSSCSAGNGTSRRHRTSHATPPIATRSRPGRPGGRPLRGKGLVAARPARSRPRFSSKRPSSCSAGNGSNRRHRTSHATLADRHATASRPTGRSAASRKGPRCSLPRALPASLRRWDEKANLLAVPENGAAG